MKKECSICKKECSICKKECSICKKEFEATSEHQTICSDACKQEALAKLDQGSDECLSCQ